MADRSFCHLHCHTHYSLLDGFNRIPELVKQTKKLGMNACAITDHGNLYGAIEFYTKCKDEGIKPIIGYEAYVAPGDRRERKKVEGNKSFHLTMLAKNEVGFRNLIKLSSIAFLEGFYYNPRIDKEILEAHSEGLIILSGCLAGELSDLILRERHDEAAELAKWYERVFGEDYYLEIQNNGLDLQDTCTQVVEDMAAKLGIPMVATADAHYLCAADAEPHDVLFCINTERKHNPNKRLYPEGRMPNPYYVRSPDDMYGLFPKHSQAVAMSQEIANKVDIQIDLKKRHFPVFQAPNKLSEDQYLRQLCEKGVYERYGETPSQAVWDRLGHELNIIQRMRYSAYFLIVWDFVRFAREQGIPCTARGSGCGAIVAYALYMSHVCPLEYDLLFERFLDPNRSEPPDIDIDFCQDRRELVIEYVKKKYGHESVAQIGTFGTLAAKAALKDVGRALEVPLDRVNVLCKLVPMKGAISLDLKDAMESPDFRREYDSDPQAKKLIDIAMKLEGLNRNVGTHAAGVVIANGPITDYVPVQRVVRKNDDKMGEKKDGEVSVTTQWEMGILEKVGMLKMDFLGLRNLTVLDNTVKLILRTRGETIDPLKFPLDDRATYQLLQKGDAKGVFQLESEGIRGLLQRMKPDNIRDLIAVLALYRPGPLGGGMVDSYVNRKLGRETWTYPHPVLKDILDETYGVMCIHEDTRIAMADGTEKPIKHVRRWDLVHSMNLDTREIEIKECHGCGPTRRGEGLKITLENGFAVTLTPDHQVRTWDGWVEAQDLDIENHIVAIGVETRPLPAEYPQIAPWLGTDDDVAYLFGQLVGDGCLTQCGVTIATGTKVNHTKLVGWLKERLPSLHVHEYHNVRSWYVNLSNPELLGDPTRGNRKTRLHALLESHDLKKKAIDKRVPEVIFRSPASVRAAFLAGLFDADGCFATTQKGHGVAFFTTASMELRNDFRRLLQLDGIIHTLYPQRVQIWNLERFREIVEPYLVVKQFPEVCTAGKSVGWIPFQELRANVLVGETHRAFGERTGIQRKVLTLKPQFVKSSLAFKAGIDLGDVRYIRIRSIESVDDQQFYGMSVQHHHNLIANGIVVKNCYQEQIMRILNRLGGIELSKAYACIKAISKKIHEKIDSARADFLTGCAANGVDDATATDIFDKIVFFAGYGFNKCVVGETVIQDADSGERLTVEELFRNRREMRVLALNDREKLVPRDVTDVVWNGRKKVYRLKTELGYEITATANHPFRTLDSWTNLADLDVGTQIATPRELKMSGGVSWPRHEIITLAGLLSEGNTCHPTTLYFYGNDREMIDDFASAISQFPDTVARIYTRRGHRHEVAANTGATRLTTNGERKPSRSGAFRWAESLGILGKTATEKYIPPTVFQLQTKDIELFLGRLWSGDGFIANRTLKVPFYATSSVRLSQDVQQLLLRVGIVSRIHCKQFKYKDELRPGFTVHVIGDGGPERFLERIAPHCVGRNGAIDALRQHFAATERGRTSKDVIPVGVRNWVDAARLDHHFTWSELEAESDVSTQEFYGKPTATKMGFRRETIGTLARHLRSEKLSHIAQSDLYWDRVVSIEYVGIRDTYDLTVDADHNFIANGIIVHNSHTAAYAQIGYQTAYLKAHYTAEFMAALLTSEIDDGAKRDVMVEHIADAKRLGVDVLPPNVNTDRADFDVNKHGQITFGLTAIKGLGRNAAVEIVNERDKNGRYKDLFDMCERVDSRVVSRAAVERMIKAGALDAFGKRAAMVLAVEKAFASAEQRMADKKRGQKSFFDMLEGSDEETNGSANHSPMGLNDTLEWPEREKLKFEKEALDFYISSHPLAQYDDQLRRFRTYTTAEAIKLPQGTTVVLAGMVTGFQVRTAQKSGKRWAMLQLEDFNGQAKCILWSEAYAQFKDVVVDDAIVLFEGAVEWRDGGTQGDVIVKRVLDVEQARREMCRVMLLRMNFSEDAETIQKFEGLKASLTRYRGNCPVHLSVRDRAGKVAELKLSKDLFIDPNKVIVDELEQILGRGNVIFTR